VQLSFRIEQLEYQQSIFSEKFKNKSMEIKSSITKELEEASVDISGELKSSIS
jgi:hypothetical protein